MPLTASTVIVTDYLFNLINTNKAALTLEAVYYGDQDRLPVTPVACVEPNEKARELKGVPRKTDVTIEVFIFVYHSEVQSTQVNRRDADLMAENIETLIHADRTLGGNVIHNFVTRVESGYARKSNTVVRASRLTVQALSQQHLPQ